MMAPHCIFVFIRKHDMGIYACVLFSKQISSSCPSFIYKPTLKATHTFVTIKNHVLEHQISKIPIWIFINPFIIYLEKGENFNSVWSNIVWYEIIMTCNCFVVEGDVFLFLVQMLMWAPNSLSHSLYMCIQHFSAYICLVFVNQQLTVYR